MKAIIFGASGQDGYYLQKLLRRENIEIIAVSRRGNGIIADIGNFSSVEHIIKEHKPDLIFHFAAPDEELDSFFSIIQKSLSPKGALWVIMPKQKQAKALGYLYDWNILIASALKTTLVDNKTLTFSPEEYGTRFVIRKELRGSGA